MQNLKPGSSLQGGRYKIIRELGAGSFGITYLALTRVKAKASFHGNLGHYAEDQVVEAEVCIKEFFMHDINSRSENGFSVEGTSNTLYANYRRKFRKEAENLSKLNHPNIVKVLDVFDENGTTYYVMQYIKGNSLDDYILNKGRISETEARGQILSIAKALKYMHDKKMLHLDLKPKNIMRGHDGNLYLIDFGLSKQYDANGRPETNTKIGGGTPGYAPTEQSDYKADGTFPATLDIYALGATLLKMLTGKTPPSANEVLNNGLPSIPYNVSSSLWNVVEQAMQPRKAERLQNVSAFLDLLKDDISSEDIDVISDDGKRFKVDKKNSKPRKILRFLFIILISAIASYALFIKHDSSPMPSNENISDTIVQQNDYPQTLYDVNGTSYYWVGSWSEGKPNGEGVITYLQDDKDGRKEYKGAVRNGLRNDESAILLYTNGNSYKGSFINDKLNRGKLILKSDGMYFEGSFRDNQPYNGKWYFNNGTLYSTVIKGIEK